MRPLKDREGMVSVTMKNKPRLLTHMHRSVPYMICPSYFLIMYGYRVVILDRNLSNMP